MSGSQSGFVAGDVTDVQTVGAIRCETISCGVQCAEGLWPGGKVVKRGMWRRYFHSLQWVLLMAGFLTPMAAASAQVEAENQLRDPDPKVR